MSIENICFSPPKQSPLTTSQFSLNLEKQDEQIKQVILRITVDFAVYQQIEEENLFNLKPELKAPNSDCQFNPELPIEIELCLNPDLLPLVREIGTDSETIINYLSGLNHASFQGKSESEITEINPLISTENWLCLSVKQNQPLGEIGYQTFWKYVDFAKLTQDSDPGESLADGMFNFIKDWTDVGLAEITEKATEEIVGEINSFFDRLGQELLSDLDSPEIGEQEQKFDKPSIFRQVVDFFSTENWSFVERPEKSALNLNFRGKNGQWRCYAKVKEEKRQFVFYSLFPLNIPDNKIPAITEFITRVNHTIILGNFDLDSTTGNLRYKTSIQLGDNYVSYDLIKPVVEENVKMMDLYLSQIIALIDEDI